MSKTTPGNPFPRFEKLNIVAATSTGRHRIAKIIFGRDGSMYVAFPSFRVTEGLVAHIRLKAGTVYPTNISLAKEGKVAGHLVKYSHHSDGSAHFSQTGRVRTEVGRHACPLGELNGHMFTINAQGLDEFGASEESDTTPALTLNVPENLQVLKLAFWRYGVDDFRVEPAGMQHVRSPLLPVQFPNGKMVNAMCVSPPETPPLPDSVLAVVPTDAPWLFKSNQPCLIFIGGFDNSRIMRDHSRDTGFLTFMYPCSDPAELRNTLGSIDLVENTI